MLTAAELGEEALFEAFEYLDELRESGRTNMWLGASFIVDELAWHEAEAKAAHGYWMKTFAHVPLAERVAKAIDA